MFSVAKISTFGRCSKQRKLPSHLAVLIKRNNPKKTRRICSGDSPVDYTDFFNKVGNFADEDIHSKGEIRKHLVIY